MRIAFCLITQSTMGDCSSFLGFAYQMSRVTVINLGIQYACPRCTLKMLKICSLEFQKVAKKLPKMQKVA